MTVSVLSIMIAAFGNILLQCKRVTSTSHRILRTNHQVSVISGTIRRDFRRLTRDAFLYIGQSDDDHGAMVFCSGEPTRSLLKTTTAEGGSEGARGFGSFIAYGLCQQEAAADGEENDPPYDVLWRPEYIFHTDGNTDLADLARKVTGSPVTLQDVKSWGADESDSDEQSAVTKILAQKATPVTMTPKTVLEAADLWKVMSKDIAYLSIMWTSGDVEIGEGSKPASYKWYGLPWVPGDKETPGAYGEPVPDPDGGSLPMLWTGGGSAGWPKAVKVEIGLTTYVRTPSGEEARIVAIEVICDVLP
ncbi:MAG: hypothetical protein ACYS8X_04315 [Planctomycetota bacterium]